MRRFFAEKIENNTAVLTGSEAEHLSRVLRLKAGDPILVAGEGEEYVCRLVQVEKQRAEAEILQTRPCLADPRRRITLYLAYMKSDKMEIVAQKAVELGVSALRPFISSRCVKVPEEKAAAKARERMSRIAFEALKQCGRPGPWRWECLFRFPNSYRRFPGMRSRCLPMSSPKNR